MYFHCSLVVYGKGKGHILQIGEHWTTSKPTKTTSKPTKTPPNPPRHLQTHQDTSKPTKTPPNPPRHIQAHQDTSKLTKTPPNPPRHLQTHQDTSKPTKTPPNPPRHLQTHQDTSKPTKTPPNPPRHLQTHLDELQPNLGELTNFCLIWKMAFCNYWYNFVVHIGKIKWFKRRIFCEFYGRKCRHSTKIWWYDVTTLKNAEIRRNHLSWGTTVIRYLCQA